MVVSRTGRYAVLVIVGSACFWASGYLTFLSPALFLNIYPTTVNIEIAYFSSQATAALFALIALPWTRRAGNHLASGGIILSGLFLTALSAGLTFATLLAPDNFKTMLTLGAFIGLCFPLLAAAWGARYTLEGTRIIPIILLSFLLSFLLFFIVSFFVPPVARTVITIALPLLSIVIWLIDFEKRKRLAPELSLLGKNSGETSISEINAGETSLRTLPWRALLVLGIAAFIGDLISSVLMGFGYEGAATITYSGFLCGALFIVLFAVLAYVHRQRFSIEQVYRYLFPLVTFGLLCILVFGSLYNVISIGILRGTGLFFQVLMFILISQVTHQKGLSPLLSFGIGIGVVSALIFLGNVLGKIFILSFSDSDLAISLTVALAIIALVVLLSTLPASNHRASGIPEYENEYAEDVRDICSGDVAADDDATSLSMTNNESDGDRNLGTILTRKVQLFADDSGLSKREAEVMELLVRGRSTPYIATQMYITSGTVKTHLVHIYRKLGVSGRQESIDLFDRFQG